jgi:hypothetical protein
MGARQKLNQAHIIAALVLAAVLGAAFDSWWMFFLALLIAVVCSIHAGSIRLNGKQ